MRVHGRDSWREPLYQSYLPTCEELWGEEWSDAKNS